MKAIYPLVATLLFAAPLALPTTPAQAQPSQSYGAKSGLSWPRLRRGVHGYQTKALQNLLIVRGYKIGADGIFGSTTQTALRSFQKAHKLKVDGVAGSQTWEALVPYLQRGSRGRAVTTFQSLLNGNNHPLRSDGIYGNTTAKVVLEFQDEKGIETTANADARTWCLLLGGSLPQGD